jgi:hypothetical protein
LGSKLKKRSAFIGFGKKTFHHPSVMYNATHYPSSTNYFIKGEMSDSYKKRMEKSTGQSFTHAHRKQPKRYYPNKLVKGSRN